MGQSLAQFTAALPQLIERGFPAADPTTGNFDLDAIKEWRRRRYPQLFGLTAPPRALDARSVVRGRVAGLPRNARVAGTPGWGK
jgi:hypothetical protein